MKQQAMAKRTADKEAGNCQATGLQENFLEILLSQAHTHHIVVLSSCPVRPRVEAPREMTMHLLPVSPPGRGQVCCPYPLLRRPLICHRNGGAALRSA